MLNFLILVEMLKNCNHIHKPNRAQSFKQWQSVLTLTRYCFKIQGDCGDNISL